MALVIKLSAAAHRRRAALRRRVARLALGALLVHAAAAARLEAQPAAQEYEVKAAFLYNFVKFVVWPPGVLDRSADMVLCIQDHDPFGHILDSVVEGKTVQDKQLVVRRLNGNGNVHGCNVLFISASDQSSLSNVLNQATNLNVLTVGETDDFLARGGIISFLMEGNKVRFAINAEVSQRSGLQISSQLLKLATNVVPSPSAAQK